MLVYGKCRGPVVAKSSTQKSKGGAKQVYEYIDASENHGSKKFINMWEVHSVKFTRVWTPIILQWI